MKRVLKRGFTIVELAIVIAVIAILAAVLVPTITNLVMNAKVSSDTALVRNLNTALATEEAKDGKNTTMSEALADADEYGYDISKIFPSESGNDILWDSKNDRFALVNGEGNEIFAETGLDKNNLQNYWKISDTYGENEKYSVYLTGKSTKKQELTVSTGIDVGANKNISIVYQSNGNAAADIFMNGGTLTVNAPDGTVNHYGTASEVKVTEVASESYHLFGTVTKSIVVEKGHVVIESGAKVAGVNVTAKTETAVTIDNKATESIKVSATEPEVAAKLDTIVKSGNVETITVASDADGTTYFAGGLGTETNPYLISGVDGWLKFRSSGLASSAKYFKVTTDLDFTGRTEKIDIWKLTGAIDFDNHYVKGITSISQCGYKFSSSYGALFYRVDGNASVSNLNFEMKNLGSDYSVRLCINAGTSSGSNILFKNVTIYGNVIYDDNNTGSFAWAFFPGSSLTLENCVTAVNITNSKLTGGFIGKIQEGSYSSETIANTNLTFKNCRNTGTLQSTNDFVAMLIGNSCGNKNILKENIAVTNCVNEGSLLAASGKAARLIDTATGATSFESDFAKAGMAENNGTMATVSVQTITVKQNAVFDFSTVVDAAKYTLTYAGFASSGSIWGTYSLTFTFTDKTAANINAYKFIGDDEAGDLSKTEAYGTTYYTTVVDGVTYYVLNSGDGAKFTKEPTITLIAYNEDGSVKAIYNYVFEA